MEQDPIRPRRRSIRLRDYDYAQAGAYFITIVTKDRLCLFGEVVEGALRVNELGRMVQTVWEELPGHYHLSVQCDAFVVMPNHIHGIITLADNGASGKSDVGAGFKPARGVEVGPNSARAGLKPAPTLSEVVRALKTFSARRINELRGSPGVAVWQRNYYEHVVRGEIELHRIREYIANNSLQWKLDRENPLRISDGVRRRDEPWEV